MKNICVVLIILYEICQFPMADGLLKSLLAGGKIEPEELAAKVKTDIKAPLDDLYNRLKGLHKEPQRIADGLKTKFKELIKNVSQGTLHKIRLGSESLGRSGTSNVPANVNEEINECIRLSQNGITEEEKKSFADVLKCVKNQTEQVAASIRSTIDIIRETKKNVDGVLHGIQQCIRKPSDCLDGVLPDVILNLQNVPGIIAVTIQQTVAIVDHCRLILQFCETQELTKFTRFTQVQMENVLNCSVTKNPKSVNIWRRAFNQPVAIAIVHNKAPHPVSVIHVLKIHIAFILALLTF